MNIYQKLTIARNELLKLNLKKSGRVSFKTTNYTYYDMGDFFPAINELCLKHGMTTKFITTGKEAVLTIINNDDPTDKINFVANISGVIANVVAPENHMKNWGGKITYMRRYMMLTAFEMAESDMIEEISKNLNNEISEKDLKKIEGAKTMVELTKVCGELKQNYKVALINPLYESKKAEIQQNADEKVIDANS